LKFLIQWVALSEATRNADYFTFGEKELDQEEISNMMITFKNKSVQVRHLTKCLLSLPADLAPTQIFKHVLKNIQS